MVVFDSRAPRPLPGAVDENRDVLPLPPGSLRFNRRRVKALFDALDKDGSGFIDAQELQSYFQRIADEPPEDADSPGEAHVRTRRRERKAQLRDKTAADKLSHELLQECHAQEGQISFQQFQDFVLQRELELWSLFQTLDTSGDGRLDREELKAALADELELSLHEQDRFIDGLEAHSIDGKLSFPAFRDIFLLNPDEHTSLGGLYEYYADTHRFGHSVFGLDLIVLPPEAARAEELQSGIVLATGISAAVARIVTAPLDRIRLFYQLGGMPMAPHRARRGTRIYARPHSGSKLAVSIKQIAKDGGLIRGLWRGTAINLLKLPLEASCRVLTLGYFRFKVAEYEGRPDEPHDISRRGMFAAASASTAVAAVLLQPLDNIRTRMMSGVERIADADTDLKALTDKGRSKARAPAPTLPGRTSLTMAQSAARILQTQGLRGFWKGTTATLFSTVPFMSMSEALYDSFEKRWFDKNPPGPSGYVGFARSGCVARSRQLIASNTSRHRRSISSFPSRQSQPRSPSCASTLCFSCERA
ncbi:mitochondrial carrier domain-containing protein [Hyaloraphidium curvatum]|nr:mitochondrial carrier domain-containing protein [Hyaloraphidium curvatum]